MDVVNRRKPSSGRVRILSNYVRLCSTFVLGLLLVRLLLQLGQDAFGIVALLGAGTGLVASLRQIIRISMIPELGAAYHDDDPETFPQVFAASFVFSLATGIVSLIVLAAIGFCLPLMRIPEEMLTAARWFSGSK